MKDMRRLHLFEFEDFKWFPDILRNYMTDFLQFGANKFDLYKPVVPIIQKGLSKSRANKIIDLASGGGGGLIQLSKHLITNNPELKVLLTDFYPNIEAFKHTAKESSCFEYITDSIDAMNVPTDLVGLRTQFLSLHHFKPPQARQILQNALITGNPIAIFEAQERSFLSLLAMFFSPLTVLITTPMIRPFTVGRIVFTYLIPLVPLFVWWDGIVSSLRTYSIDEMNELIDGLDSSEKFEWETGKVKSGPGNILYLLGYKK